MRAHSAHILPCPGPLEQGFEPGTHTVGKRGGGHTHPQRRHPECHHATGDHRLRTAPIVKKTLAVKAIASSNACGSPTANGDSGLARRARRR